MMRGFWPLYVFAFKSQSGSGPASFEPVLRYAPRRTSAVAKPRSVSTSETPLVKRACRRCNQGRLAALLGRLTRMLWETVVKAATAAPAVPRPITATSTGSRLKEEALLYCYSKEPWAELDLGE